MSVLENLTEEECYLVAILQDLSGIDTAEFSWHDDRSANGLFRAYPYQFKWWRSDDRQQIDQGARAVGKSVSIQLRATSFVFNYPGEEMLLTAPETIHLDPVTKYVEERLSSVRLTREMLHTPRNSVGFRHRPFEAQFVNGARIIGRIPQRDGRGVKGCVASGSVVVTREGLVPIDDVKPGDLVLTHQGRWQKVLANYRYESPDAVVVRGGGHAGLVCSDNHRLYARRHQNPQRKMRLGPATWAIVSDEELAGRWYLGSPTRFPFVPFEVPQVHDQEALFWVAGRYVADGVLDKRNGRPIRFTLIDDPKEREEIGSMLDRLGATWSVSTKESGADSILVGGVPGFASWLDEHFGSRSDGKKLPIWLLGADAKLREAFLSGYLGGDGHWDKRKERWTASTASRALAVGLRLLSQTLGYRASLGWVDPQVSEIMGRPLVNKPQRSYRVIMSTGGRNGHVEDGILWSKVRRVDEYEESSDNPLVVYDLAVDVDHSYVVDAIVSHNMHPMCLEMDEAADYPTPGWVELIETLKFGNERSRWRVHGVTRGVRDYFHKLTQSKEWKVHRPVAMNRGDWSEAERRSKIELYGGRESPDYRRNILGLHGDSTSSLFVLARLMANVDTDETSDYNRGTSQDGYYFTRITDEWVNESSLPITELVTPPASHTKAFGSFWIGSDIGMTLAPTEILVFGEDKKGILVLVTRISLHRISAMDQVTVFEKLANFYRAGCVALDRTGVGLPIYQMALDRGGHLGTVVRGYNFSEKIQVGNEPVALAPTGSNLDRSNFDPELADDPDPDQDEAYPSWDVNTVNDRAIMANTLEYASDMMREIVDRKGLRLPYDVELLKEFQGQTYVITKSTINPYGRKEFSRGKFHTLDAARMAVLGKRLIEVESQAPVEMDEMVPIYWGDDF